MANTRKNIRRGKKVRITMKGGLTSQPVLRGPIALPEKPLHSNPKNVFPNTTPPLTNPFKNPSKNNVPNSTNPFKNEEERNAAAKNENPWRLNEYNYNKKRKTGNPFSDPKLGVRSGANNSITFPNSRRLNVPVSMLNNSARRNLMISASAAIKRMGKSANYNDLQRQVRELSEALKKCCDDIPEYSLGERESANASAVGGIMRIAQDAAAAAPANQRVGIIQKIKDAALSAAKGLKGAAGATANGIFLVAKAAAAAAAAPFIALGSLAKASGKASAKVSPEQVRADPGVQEAAAAAQEEARRRGASQEESEKAAELAFDAAISTAVKATRGGVEYILAGAAISAMQVVNAIRGILPSIGRTSSPASPASPAAPVDPAVFNPNVNVNNPFNSSAINAHERKLERNRELASVLTPEHVEGVAAAAAASVPAPERESVIQKIRDAVSSATQGLQGAAGATANGINLVAHAAAAAAAAPFIALSSLAKRSGKASAKVSPEQVRADPGVQEAAAAAEEEARRRGASQEESEKVAEAAFDAAVLTAAKATRGGVEYILTHAVISAMQVVNAVRGILPSATRESLGRNRTLTQNGNTRVVLNPIHVPNTPQAILNAHRAAPPNTPQSVLNDIRAARAARATNEPVTPEFILRARAARAANAASAASAGTATRATQAISAAHEASINPNPTTQAAAIAAAAATTSPQSAAVSAAIGEPPNPFIRPINTRNPLPKQTRRTTIPPNPVPNQKRRSNIVRNPLHEQVQVAQNPLHEQVQVAQNPLHQPSTPPRRRLLGLFNPKKWGKGGGSTKKIHKYKKSKNTNKTKKTKKTHKVY